MPKPWQRYGFPKPKSEASKGPQSFVDNEIYSGILIPANRFSLVITDSHKFNKISKTFKLDKHV